MELDLDWMYFVYERAQMHISHPGLSRIRLITSKNQCRVLDRQTGTQVGHLQKSVLEVLYSYSLQTHPQSYDHAEIRR